MATIKQLTRILADHGIKDVGERRVEQALGRLETRRLVVVSQDEEGDEYEYYLREQWDRMTS